MADAAQFRQWKLLEFREAIPRMTAGDSRSVLRDGWGQPFYYRSLTGARWSTPPRTFRQLVLYLAISEI